MTSWHIKSYNVISSAAVYLEQVIHNETIYHQTHENTFIEELTKMDKTLYSILCKIQTALSQLGRLVDNVPSRDIMSNQIRSIDNYSYLHSRDYIIVKDIFYSINSLIPVYQRVYNSLF